LLCLDVSAAGQCSPSSDRESTTNGKSQSPTPVPTMLVMCGGEGYIDFRVGTNNTGNDFIYESVH